MKSKINEQKKLIDSLISCIFILLILIFSLLPISFGWFSTNYEITPNGMSIMANDKDLGIDISFFNVAENGVTTNTLIIDGIPTKQKSITFNPTEKTNMPILPLYDILEETTHYILIKFSSYRAFTLTISTNTTYVLDSSKLLLAGNGRGIDYSNWISSVIFFQPVVINDNTYSTTLSNNPFTFVDKSNYEMKVINNTLSIDCVANSSIYFIVGYDSTLVERLFSQNIGNTNLKDLDNAGVNFINDCIYKVFSQNETEGIII